MSRGDPGVLFSEYSAFPLHPPKIPLCCVLSPDSRDLSCGITELLQAMAKLQRVENLKLLAPNPRDNCDLKFVDAYNVLRSHRGALNTTVSNTYVA